MPLYEYQCDACGAQFELIRKFSDPPVEVCPTCGAARVRKLLSSPAFQFKGSGWYVTDYARKGGEAAPKDAPAAKADAKADAKPEAAKETSPPAADKPAAALPPPATSGKDK
jgi:putative FmdB family regulatory protein